MKDEVIEELLAKAVQDELSSEESKRFLTACQDDETLRWRFARLIQVDRLAGLAMSDDGEVFSREFRFRAEADGDDQFSTEVISRIKGHKRSKMVKLVTGWTAAAALVVLSFFFLATKNEELVVEIVRMEASDWAGENSYLKVGERVRFEEGLVELFYQTGVRVVLEAPADFEVTSKNQGFLHHGKLVAEVNDVTAHGFVIDGPAGRLVDLGTSFAVAVDDQGEMEVHVIEGLVDATATGGTTLRLEENQAMRLSAGKGSPMDLDLGKFVTRMPDYLNEPSRYVRWGFDERTDSMVKNTGRELASRNADGELKSFSGNGSGAKRVDGPFGKGLEFDGEDSFFTTEFPGIAGSEPRTVAFWVKVPRDFDEKQGYGTINWGKVRVRGGAWQISANGTARNGPLGRLRIGTHWGQVIGTTDLRDGEWHHCAVVMYGDEEGKPNTATHVLLYVDGKLEPAARKSVQAVDTVALPKDQGGSHGVWMGRNLGFEHEGDASATEYGRFFRGSVDEMIITDMAMSQRQILRLMERNEMPD